MTCRRSITTSDLLKARRSATTSQSRILQAFGNPWQGFPGGNPFPRILTKDSTFINFGGYENMPLNAKSTYSQQWNLSIQRQVGSNWLVLEQLCWHSDRPSLGRQSSQSGSLSGTRTMCPARTDGDDGNVLDDRKREQPSETECAESGAGSIFRHDLADG